MPSELRGPETILLAEDNPQVKELSFTVLKELGYTVRSAENGQKAQSIIESHDGPVHLLFTDVVMPEID